MTFYLVGIGGLLIGLLGALFWARTAQRPANLGLTEGQLAPCPGTPNCVSSLAEDPAYQMPPIPFKGDPARALERLRSLLSAWPRTRVGAVEGPHLSATFRSRYLGFIDDVEFLVGDAEQIIHFRSASRLGRSDFGANRNRMTAIRDAFGSQESHPQSDEHLESS